MRHVQAGGAICFVLVLSGSTLAQGGPDLRTVKVDVSKRRKHDMGFWHRNIDAHEIIFCVKGALKWETEMGVRVMHPGDMLFIPKGIGHRSMLCEDSSDDNVLIELKIADDLTYVGEAGK